jgi:hypothetical protein
MKREEAIKKLIGEDITDLQQMFANNDYFYIEDILSGGFQGYLSYTNEMLALEIWERDEIKVEIKD